MTQDELFICRRKVGGGSEGTKYFYYEEVAPYCPTQNNEDIELQEYDAGQIGSGGEDNIEWWQDYIRAELGRAYDYYQAQLNRRKVK